MLISGLKGLQTFLEQRINKDVQFIFHGHWTKNKKSESPMRIPRTVGMIRGINFF